MKIGNKILNLRKQNNITQEQLAEKMGVARQTISKWELGETSPDLEQSKQLSKIFNISLDDLTDNNLTNVLITKVSNIEKLTKIVLNILKIILLIIIISIIIGISIILCREYFSAKPTSSTTMFISCKIDNKKYTYKVEEDSKTKILKIYTDDKKLNIDSNIYDDDNLLIQDIKKDVISRGGNCDVEELEK